MSARQVDPAKVGVVVGGGGGQGRAVAEALHERGLRVAVLDRDGDAARAVARSLDPAGRTALGWPCDVVRPRDVEEVLTAVVDALGAPWYLAVTAGVLQGGLALDHDEAVIRRVLEVNLVGVMRVDAAFAREMAAAGRGGRIVNWSSISSKAAAPGYSAYSASKAALEAYSRTLAIELAPAGITVNVIVPGSVDTPMLGYLDPEQVEAEARRIPLGRWGAPRDVAGLAAFLAGNDAGWITGAELRVDGGASQVRNAPIDLAAVRARLEWERAVDPARSAPPPRT